MNLSNGELVRQLELLATPVDFDQLCADGILERVSKRRYKLLDGSRLPKYASMRILSFTDDSSGPSVLEFEDTTKWAQKKLEKVRGRSK